MWEGILLGLLTFGGFFAVFRKFPRVIKRIISHPKVSWIADILLTIGAYLLLSGITSSFGGALSCAITGLLVSIYLAYYGENEWKKVPASQ